MLELTNISYRCLNWPEWECHLYQWQLQTSHKCFHDLWSALWLPLSRILGSHSPSAPYLNILMPLEPKRRHGRDHKKLISVKSKLFNKSKSQQYSRHYFVSDSYLLPSLCRPDTLLHNTKFPFPKRFVDVNGFCRNDLSPWWYNVWWWPWPLFWRRRTKSAIWSIWSSKDSLKNRLLVLSQRIQQFKRKKEDIFNIHTSIMFSCFTSIFNTEYSVLCSVTSNSEGKNEKWGVSFICV